MSFKEYKNLNLVQISNKILEYWKTDNTFFMVMLLWVKTEGMATKIGEL